MSKPLRQILLFAAWSQRLVAAEPQAGRTEIQWESIQGCPTESEVRRQVEERLGQPLDAPREQSLRLHAKVMKGLTGKYEVALSTEGASGIGQRRISNADCARLAEATSLVMAIAIDPTRVEERFLEATGSDTSGVSSPGQTLDARTSSQPASPSPIPAVLDQTLPDGSVQLMGTVRISAASTSNIADRNWSLGAKVLVGTGVLPVIDLGMMATASFFPLPTLALRVGAGGLLPEHTTVVNSNGSMTLTANFVDASICVVPQRREWQSHLCAGTQVGLMGAEGRNLTNGRSASAAYSSLVIDTGFGYRLGAGNGVVASVTSGVGILRPVFGVRRNGEPEQAYRSDLVAVRIGLGLFWDLP